MHKLSFNIYLKSDGLEAHLENMTPLNFFVKAGNMEEFFIYMNSVMSGMFPSLFFRFKTAMAANSKMAAIGLRKIFLAICIKQFLEIHK